MDKLVGVFIKIDKPTPLNNKHLPTKVVLERTNTARLYVGNDTLVGGWGADDGSDVFSIHLEFGEKKSWSCCNL